MKLYLVDSLAPTMEYVLEKGELLKEGTKEEIHSIIDEYCNKLYDNYYYNRTSKWTDRKTEIPMKSVDYGDYRTFLVYF